MWGERLLFPLEIARSSYPKSSATICTMLSRGDAALADLARSTSSENKSTTIAPGLFREWSSTKQKSTPAR